MESEVWLAVVALIGTLGTATLGVVGTYFKLKFDAQLVAERAARERLETRINELETDRDSERVRFEAIITALTSERDTLAARVGEMENKLKWL